MGKLAEAGKGVGTAAVLGGAPDTSHTTARPAKQPSTSRRTL